MAGIGIAELAVIIVIGAVLFGAPLLTFFVGYAVGKSRAARVTAPTTGATPAVLPEPPAPPASPTHAEEPVDE